MKASLVLCCLLLLHYCSTAQSEKNKRNIIPHHAKIQFAGSIGFISAGAGYELAKKKLQADLMYGYVPKKVGGVNIHSITAKLTWLPVSISSKDFKFDLLTAGILVNYAFGKQYHLSRESLVYYEFPTAAHVALFAGGGIAKNKIGLYYEVGTTDRDLISFVNNSKGLKFNEIINIGFGARIRLR